MKQTIIALVIVALFVVGAGGTYWYINGNAQSPTNATEAEPASASNSASSENSQAQHGNFPQIPPGAQLCSTHRIPEMVCPFCNPDNIEQFGHCGGHDVPEALCTRCNPILINAFQAEGDWCAEHDLPQSQCQICQADKG